MMLNQREAIEMYEFDFESDLKDNGFVIIFGKRGSGKTSLTRVLTQLVPNAFRVQWVFFVGTEEVKKLYSSISHPYYVREPTKTAFKEILELQKWKVEICEAYHVPFPIEWELHIVCDDCAAYEWFMRNAQVKEIASNGRNCHITFYALIQKFEQLEPTSRENPSTFIALRTQNETLVTKFHKYYASSMPKDRFKDMYLETTSSRKALCINCVESDDKNHNFAYTHCSLLHPDGFEAAANQDEIDMFNRARAKKGLPQKIYDPANLLKRLGHQIHYDVAVENFRQPTMENMIKSNTLLKFAFANSMGTPIQHPPFKSKRKKSICSFDESLAAIAAQTEQDKKSTDVIAKSANESSDNESDSENECSKQTQVFDVASSRANIQFHGKRPPPQVVQTKKTSRKKSIKK